MIFFKPAAFALALTAFGVTPAFAQEQENPSTPGQIPDPSTYQGSTVLQQQSSPHCRFGTAIPTTSGGPDRCLIRGAFPPLHRRLAMVAGANISQFRSLLNEATPEDLVTIAPLLLNRIGTLDQSRQEQFIQQVKSDPQAKNVFEKMKTFTQ
jgi:hypothetical protein